MIRYQNMTQETLSPNTPCCRWFLRMTLTMIFFLAIFMLYAQRAKPVYGGTNLVLINPGETPEQIIEKASQVTPSANQLTWQQLDFNAFIHFGINTFTGREWGSGTENPALFKPTALDARQWVRVIRDAGMKMVIMTAKHHDGFCLWPSKYTKHSVAASPWKNGKGDVVREVADACREYGLKFGIYLSPWDRHEPTYGKSDAYNQFFKNQLRELLTGYGEISEVWFDGACGEGANGLKQHYDWPAWYALIRELQPQAVIAIMGPDVRWVGTESGYGRNTEWSVLPDIVQLPDSVAAASQQHPADGGFIPGDLTDSDLGSREKLLKARSLVWYPAETDVSIRPGWFYHSAEDNRVKTPQKLADIYFHSAGMNSVLLLNIPPDKRGLIHQKDIASLQGMKKILEETFKENLLDGVMVSGAASPFEYTLRQPSRFNTLMIREDIKVGQRIEKFHLEALEGNRWITVTGGTTVGNKRLLRFPAMTAQKVRLVIDELRADPAIMQIGLYLGPDLEEPVKTVPKTDGTLTLGTAYSQRYTAGGDYALADGFRGSYEFTDGRWQGYEGEDVIATVDLGSVKPVSKIWAGFLQQTGSWIFMPVSVEYFTSMDGKTFKWVAQRKSPVGEKAEGTEIRDFAVTLKNARARYVRIHAHNRGVCPVWHPGAGQKAWLFVDEIGIRP